MKNKSSRTILTEQRDIHLVKLEDVRMFLYIVFTLLTFIFTQRGYQYYAFVVKVVELMDCLQSVEMLIAMYNLKYIPTLTKKDIYRYFWYHRYILFTVPQFGPSTTKAMFIAKIRKMYVQPKHKYSKCTILKLDFVTSQ